MRDFLPNIPRDAQGIKVFIHHFFVVKSALKIRNLSDNLSSEYKFEEPVCLIVLLFNLSFEINFWPLVGVFDFRFL